MMPTRKAGGYAQDTIRFIAKIIRRIFHIMKYKSIGLYISFRLTLDQSFRLGTTSSVSARRQRDVYVFDTGEVAICVNQRGSRNNLVS